MFNVTVYSASGAIKTYSRSEFIEAFSHDDAMYSDDALNGIEEPMTGQDWASLLASKDADGFDDVVLTETPDESSYHEELHAYDVETSKTICITVKVVAHSEEEAENLAWDYMDEYDPHNALDHVTEVKYVNDNGIADRQDMDEADVCADNNGGTDDDRI